MALDRTFDDGRIQTANDGISSSTLSGNIINYSTLMFTLKRTLEFRHFKLDETAATDVSDQRRKTAELHTSGVKRAKTWPEGVEW